MAKLKIIAWVLAGLLWFAGLEVLGQITLGTQTKGILPVNQGGTNATDAATARSNLGAVGLSDSQTLSNKIITSPRINDIRGYSNSLLTVLYGEVSNAVNYLGIYQAATGSGPLLQALGTDANVDLRLRPQGAGVVDLGDMTAIKITGCAVGQYPRVASGNVLSCDAGTASGAPTSATYITQTPDAALSNEQALSLLTNGLLMNTGGVLSAATAADLPNHASRHNDGGADEIGIDGSQVISGLVADARIPTSLAGRTFTSGVVVEGGGAGQVYLRLADASAGLPACVAGSAVLYSNLGELDYCSGFTMTRYPVGNVFLNSAIPGYIPYIASANSIQSYLPPATAATPDTFAVRDSQGTLKARQHEAIPTTDSVAGVFQRYSSGQANYIFEIRREDTARMAGVDKDFNWVGNVIGNITGSAGTAGALTSNPADCPATGFAYQIDSAGNLTCRAVDLSTADTTGQLAVARLNVTGTPDSTKVLYGDRWAAPPSGGGNLGIYNVKDSPYNAVGDGVNDDTAEIQAAITACQDSARGGVVYFPYGIYGISGSGLWHGNGSTSGAGNPSTKAVCRFVGQGSGDSSFSTSGANVQISALKWIGSNPGSPTFMVTIDGPMFGWGMEDLQLWANGNSNVQGLDARHINYSHIKNVAIMDTGGGSGGAFAMKIWPQKSFSQYACYNTIENLRIRVATGSVGSALWVGGNSSLGTACSINMVGGYLNRDDNYTGGTNTATYSLLLDSSDNFHAAFTHFSDTGGNGLRNGCSIGAAVSAFSGQYPDSAHFYGISSNGMCGTTGSARPFVVWGGECGADGQGSCDYHNAFTGGGTKPISLSGEAGAELKGVGQLITRYLSTDENYKDVIINHASGGQNGAGNIYFQRDGVDIGKIKSHYFDGLGLYTSDGTGSGTLYERLRLRNNGIMTPTSVTFSTLGGEPTGSFAYCTDCQVTSVGDNTCTSGGSGALAWKVNGTWRCFATQN